ncbi:MAG: hypothetical protein HZC17_09630, partial [Candidatus Omnitrophica bacterium]|nr:hypothetical protein [Candidatus Omnitrophota bacterium]
MTQSLNVLLKKSFVFTFVIIFALSGINTGWTDTSIQAVPTQNLSLPYDLGKISDSFQPVPGHQAPLLIHIEDAHAHFATQSKIRGILNYLHKKYAVNAVFIEGAFGPIDPELFNIFPDQMMNVKAAKRWMKEGQFSAAEVFGIENGSSVALRGVENARLYEKNLKEFRETHKLFKTQQPILDEWNSRLKRIKEKIYLGDLKKWDEAATQFAAGKINILEYTHVLKELSLKHALSFEKYPELRKLFDVENAARVSPEKWQKESAEIENFIKTRIPKIDPAQKM